MLRAITYRLYLTRAQEEAGDAMLAAFCDLKNAALHERIDCYRKTGRGLRYLDQAAELKAVRAVDERLAACSFSAAQQLLRRVDKSFQAFFRRLRNGEKPGFPRFTPKRRFDSIEFRVGDGLAIKDERLRVVGIPGRIKIKWHRPLPPDAELGHATLSRKAGRWAVTFFMELPDPQMVPRRPAPVGLDLGLTHLIALSDDTLVATPKWAKQAAAGLRRHQRRLARRTQKSKRWQKAKRDLARYSERVANQRRNFSHQLTAALVDEHTHFAVEDLNIRGLARGRNARDVANAAWGQFLLMLRYKAANAGGAVEAVPAAGTSQECPCGASVPKDLSVRVHRCPACGFTADRDVAAAQVILRRSKLMGLGSSLRARSGLQSGLRLHEKLSAFS